MMTHLDRSDQRCDQRSDYNWRTCLHRLFYTYKGCQDPWDTNPRLDLPVCTNLSYILGHTHNRRPTPLSFDREFNDRPYMAEQKLQQIKRNGIQCFSPCSHTVQHVEIAYRPRHRWCLVCLVCPMCLVQDIHFHILSDQLILVTKNMEKALNFKYQKRNYIQQLF